MEILDRIFQYLCCRGGAYNKVRQSPNCDNVALLGTGPSKNLQDVVLQKGRYKEAVESLEGYIAPKKNAVAE